MPKDISKLFLSVDSNTYKIRGVSDYLLDTILSVIKCPLDGRYGKRVFLNTGSWSVTEAWRTVATEASIKGTDTNVVVWGAEVVNSGNAGWSFTVATRFNLNNFQIYPRYATTVTNAMLSYWITSDQIHTQIQNNLGV